MRGYNERVQPLNCRHIPAARWYPGFNYQAAGTIARITQGNRPDRYSLLVDEFVSILYPFFHDVWSDIFQGRFLLREGVFRRSNLGYIWPDIANEDADLDPMAVNNGGRLYSPVQGAFDYNFSGDSDSVGDFSGFAPDPSRNP